MAFSLEIQLEGLIVYFPCQSSGTADVALIGRQPSNSTKHNHGGAFHVPQFYVGAGAEQQAGGPPLPLFLDQFDIVVTDGNNPLTGTADLKRLRRHSAPLYRMFSADDLREGMLLSKHEKIAPIVAARLQLSRGTMLATNLTRDKWRLVERLNKVINGTERPLAKTFVFVTPIIADSASFHFLDGTSPENPTLKHKVTVKPVSGSDFVRVHLSNVSNVSGGIDEGLKPGQKNKVPHFDLVTSVLRDSPLHPVRMCDLQQEDKEPKEAEDEVLRPEFVVEIRRLQLPCVGGCGC